MFQEFLTRKEDYLRALRGFLREVVRVIRNEFNFTAFVRSLMQDRSESEFSQLEPTHKVCTYVCMYVCTYVRTYVCMHMYVCRRECFRH